MPNGLPTVLQKLEHKISSIFMIKSQIEEFYCSFIRPDNIDEINFEVYPSLPPGIRMFKKAGHIGKGFGIRADIEILRAIEN